MSLASPLDATIGSLFLGCFFGALLYGMSVTQCLYYYTRHPKDAWWLRLLVAVAFILNNAAVVLVMHSLYRYVITDYANPEIIPKVVWSHWLEIAFTSVTALICQCFYAFKVWYIGKNLVVAGTLVVVCLAEFGLFMAWLADAVSIKTFSELLAVSDFAIAANSTRAAFDTIAAISLVWLLHKSNTKFQPADDVVNKWIWFFVNTGLLNSLFGIAVVVSLTASSDTLIYAAWYFCLGRLYTNSLLAAVNGCNASDGSSDPGTMLPSIMARISGSTTFPANISVVMTDAGQGQTATKEFA